MTTKSQQEAIDTLAASVENPPEGTTLTHIEHTKREKAIQALFLVASGTSQREIIRQTGLHKATINRLVERHTDALKTVKSELSRNMAATAHKATQVLAKKLQQLDEDPDQLAKANVKDLSVATGVAIDKGLMLNGDPTATIEHKHVVSFDDYQETIRQAKARVIDV